MKPSPAAARGTIHLEVAVPAGTTGDVFVSGSTPALGPWNPSGRKLTPAAGGTYQTDLTGDPGTTLEFKFTRGGWDTVEKTSNGAEKPNRVAKFPDGDQPLTVRVTVDRWAVAGAAPATRPSTVTGKVVLTEIASKILGNKRRVWVWLPPGYDGSGERYPVLYLHDGRNVFDEATSSFGREWGVDESATRLIAAGEIRPAIIVAIDHGDRRTEEFGGKAMGYGRQYGRFVVEEVKPWVDAAHRTKPGRADTFVGGASLGGLVSLAMAMDFPDTFSGALVVSPSLFFEDGVILKRAEAGGVPKATRIWADIGTKEGGEGDRHVANVRRLRDALEKQGVTVREVEAEGAEHNESAWAERVPGMLKFLLGRP